jgi:ABC-2 type transport system permease protein
MKTLIGLTVANLKRPRPRPGRSLLDFFFPVMFVLLFGVLFSGSSDSKVDVGLGRPGRHAGLRQPADRLRERPTAHAADGTLDEEKAAMQRGDVSAISSCRRVCRRPRRRKAGNKASVSLSALHRSGQSSDGPGRRRRGHSDRQRLQPGRPAAPIPRLYFWSEDAASTNISTVTYLVPSILAMALMQLGVFAAVPLVQQREKGILKRMGATPLPRWKLVGQQHPAAVARGRRRRGADRRHRDAVFNVQIVGNLAKCGRLRLPGRGCLPGPRLHAGLVPQDRGAGTGVVQVVQMPLMFLSGIFFPFDFMPGFLRRRAPPAAHVPGRWPAPDHGQRHSGRAARRGRRDPRRLAGGLSGDRGAVVPLGVAVRDGRGRGQLRRRTIEVFERAGWLPASCLWLRRR